MLVHSGTFGDCLLNPSPGRMDCPQETSTSYRKEEGQRAKDSRSHSLATVHSYDLPKATVQIL